MRHVLFGTPRFGALVLAGLSARGLPPVAVVTKPARPAGRRQVLTDSAVKAEADRLGIPVLAPEKLPDIYDELRALQADCFVVASYGKILKEELLAIPPKGFIGIHPSLLPAYRGTSPIQSALMDGALETGVTLFLMDEEVDHGPVLAQESLPISPDDTYLALEERLADLGADLAARTLPRWVAGGTEAAEQDHAAATFTRKLATADGFVPCEDVRRAMEGDVALAEGIRRRIAGLTPEPGVWSEREGRRVKLLAARVEGGALQVTRYQRDGETPKEGLLGA